MVDGLLVSARIPCEDPLSILEAIPLPSPSDSVSEENEGVISGPWEVSISHIPCSTSYLDRVLSNGVVTMSEEVEDEAPCPSGQEYPPLDLEDGPHT